MPQIFDIREVGNLLPLFKLIKKISSTKLSQTSIETKFFILKHLKDIPIERANTFIDKMADMLNDTPAIQIHEKEEEIKSFLFHEYTSPIHKKTCLIPTFKAPTLQAPEPTRKEIFENDGKYFRCTSPFSGARYSIPIPKN